MQGKDTVWDLDDMADARPVLVQLPHVAKSQLISMHQLHLYRQTPTRQIADDKAFNINSHCYH